MSIEIINITGHKVVILDNDNNVVKEYPANGCDARIKYQFEEQCDIQINDTYIPLSVLIKKVVKDLPMEKENTMYIVSSIVREFCSHRKDLLSPNPKTMVYNKNGYARACKGLLKN